MAFDDRLSYLLLGMFIGFVLGRITRLDKKVDAVKEELDEVDAIVKDEKRQRDESGFIKVTFVTGIALLIVVLLSAWASFASQKASNNSQNSQDRLESLVTCNTQVLNGMVDATNERTTYSAEQIQANVELQTSFSGLLGILLHQPPYNEARRVQATTDYYDDLQHFLVVSNRSVNKLAANPYPEKDALASCIKSAVNEGK